MCFLSSYFSANTTEICFITPIRSDEICYSSNYADLPKPLFIRICVIAGILHMSGAGKQIDQALNRTGERGMAILTGADFAYFGLAEDLRRARWLHHSTINDHLYSSSYFVPC